MRTFFTAAYFFAALTFAVYGDVVNISVNENGKTVFDVGDQNIFTSVPVTGNNKGWQGTFLKEFVLPENYQFTGIVFRGLHDDDPFGIYTYTAIGLRGNGTTVSEYNGTASWNGTLILNGTTIESDAGTINVSKTFDSPLTLSTTSNIYVWGSSGVSPAIEIPFFEYESTYGISGGTNTLLVNFSIFRSVFDDTALTEQEGNIGSFAFTSAGWIDLYYDEIPSATPEPATLLIFGLGIAGLAAARRRKK